MPIQNKDLCFSVQTNCLHAGRFREIRIDFTKVNSLAYGGTVEFAFVKNV